MSTLDWKNFSSLTDNPNDCFELLCKGVIHLHFQSYGQIKALKNQPGVEAHLKLTTCHKTLGDLPRWWGWQCKWFEPESNNLLTSNQRRQIEDSLQKSQSYLPDLTDWVLWTRKELSAADARWFDGIPSKFTLHRWDHTHLETYLSGPAEILRKTYFGELVLTPTALAEGHDASVQRILTRWQHELHQTSAAEHEIRQILGESTSWSELKKTAISLETAKQNIEVVLGLSPHLNGTDVSVFIRHLESNAQRLRELYDFIQRGNHHEAHALLDTPLPPLPAALNKAPRLFRNHNLPVSIDAANALADLKWLSKEWVTIAQKMRRGLVAVIAEAGGGKTQLAAELTSASTQRPAGILLHGQCLRRGQNLDDLAKTYKIAGQPVQSMDLLLASLDAAGRRANCRLPLVIDGLNEAEDPRDWNAALATIQTSLAKFSNVLMVCTLRAGSFQPISSNPWSHRVHALQMDRNSFAAQSLPKDVYIIDSEGFGGGLRAAVTKYFAHYKIIADEDEIPSEFLAHPLTLRLFCERVNGTRVESVPMPAYPASLYSLMESYINDALSRIANLAKDPYDVHRLRQAITKLGLLMWDGNQRLVSEDRYRTLIHDQGREWQDSLVNLLIQQGIVLRQEWGDDFYLIPTYDALGGFVIARALIRKGFEFGDTEWLNESFTLRRLSGEDGHELQEDIFKALVALVPQYSSKQLWQAIAPPLSRKALFHVSSIDCTSKPLDDNTLEALRNEMAKDERFFTGQLATLSRLRGYSSHCLNAEFLDGYLRKLSVADRDLTWSEWIRKSSGERRRDVDNLEVRWRNSDVRTETDRLKAVWLVWILTTTDRPLRDFTTRSLYWYGRRAAKKFFDLCLKSLDINDPSVPERMLAVAYGIAMAKAFDKAEQDFHHSVFPEFGRKLYENVFSPGAAHSTTHVLMREYATRLIELLTLIKPDALAHHEICRTKPPFTEGRVEWGELEDPDGRSPFEFDFSNYTLGRLVPDRASYDFEHPGYKKIKSQILWRVYDFGWSPDRFEHADRANTRSYDHWGRSTEEANKVYHYGMKYSRIAYAERLGEAHDTAEQEDWRERTSEVDIDPSFPEKPGMGLPFSVNLLGGSEASTDEWIAQGQQPDIIPLLRQDVINGLPGPWLLLDGFMVDQNETLSRRCFCFIRTFLVAKPREEEFTHCLKNQDLGGRWLPEKPDVIYTFAGEIPWCSTFTSERTEMHFRKRIGTQKVIREIAEPIVISNEYESPLNLDRVDYTGLSIVLETVQREVDEPIEEITSFEVIIPVCDFGWEGHQSQANDSGHVSVLSRAVSEALELRGRPQSFDLFTDEGTQATICVKKKDGDFNDHQTLLAIREDVLQRFLDQEKLALVWTVWGEREYASDKIGQMRRNGSTLEKPYRVYQSIFTDSDLSPS